MTTEEKMRLRKMTDNEIIKALAIHINGKYNCHGCPYMAYNDCLDKIVTDSLELITRQQAEIERLESIISADHQLIKSLNKCYEISKDEAIKEFAEKLKRKAYRFPCAIGTEYAVPIRAINETVGGEE